MPARQGISAAHRARVLRALGITPWAQRGAAADTGTSDASQPGIMQGSTMPRPCVVVLPQTCSARELGLLGRALRAGGAALADAGHVNVRDAHLADVPAASTYLVFGEAQAHALGRSLPPAVLQRAQIVLVDELPLVLTDAGAKRRLWGALRGLRRTLAATSG